MSKNSDILCKRDFVPVNKNKLHIFLWRDSANS